MRRELIWALAACLLLSAWALLSPLAKSSTTAIVAPVARAMAMSVGSSRPIQATVRLTANAAEDATLHSTWPAPAMEPAARSPFASPLQLATKAVSIAPTAPPPPVQPTAPPVVYRFWGSLFTPAGDRLLYVATEDNQGPPVPVEVGTRLDGGFVVEQITPGAIVLAQAGGERPVMLSLTPPPAQGVR